jgi:CheY-like chemotaxis protein
LVERVLVQRPAIKLISAQLGQLGIDLASEHLPDVILLDLHLPDMNGDQVLTSLRSDPRTAAIPIVMLSANAIGGDMERLKQLGAFAYVSPSRSTCAISSACWMTCSRGRSLPSFKGGLA